MEWRGGKVALILGAKEKPAREIFAACKMSPFYAAGNSHEFQSGRQTLAERAALEDEKSRLFELWQTIWAKPRAKPRGCSASAPSARANGPSGCAPSWMACPAGFANMVRSEVNRLMAATVAQLSVCVETRNNRFTHLEHHRVELGAGAPAVLIG
jgi:hypothetical protein